MDLSLCAYVFHSVPMSFTLCLCLSLCAYVFHSVPMFNSHVNVKEAGVKHGPHLTLFSCVYKDRGRETTGRTGRWRHVRWLRHSLSEFSTDSAQRERQCSDKAHRNDSGVIVNLILRLFNCSLRRDSSAISCNRI